jgi:hypothetical protein
VTVVATAQEPRGHVRSTVRDIACLTTPVQPDWNVLEHHRAKTRSVVVCATKHPPKIEVNVCREIAGTVDLSFAGKIQGPMRWSPMIPDQTFTENRCCLCPGLIVCESPSALVSQLCKFIMPSLVKMHSSVTRSVVRMAGSAHRRSNLWIELLLT